jgi:hypothetical protein
MEHRAILALFMVGFCIMFFGSIFYTLGQTIRRHADIDSGYRNADRASTADTLDNANIMMFLAHTLVSPGAFILALASALGAWRIEDKYVKLGMLIFSALVTAFVLAPSVVTLAN